MPKYQITAPDGKTYEVTAPDGASQDEVLAYAKANYNSQQESNSVSKTQDKNPVSAFLSGTGGSVLDASANVADLMSKSVGDKLRSASQEGMANAPGMAGTAGKVFGSMAPYFALPGGGVLKSAAQAGALSGITSPGDMEERAKQAALTTGTSALTGGLISGLKGFTPSQGAKELMAKGIQPTVGQGIDKSGKFGWFGETLGKAEEAAKSTPIIGSVVTHARERAKGEWAKNIVKEAEIPSLGVTTKGAKGWEAVNNLQKGFTKAYDDVLKVHQVPNLPPQTSQYPFINEQLKVLGNSPTVSANDLHRVIASIRDKGFKYQKSLIASEQDTGMAYKQIADTLRTYLKNSLPADAASKINKLDSKYGSFKTIQGAATATGAESGEFSGAQLLSAVKKFDKTKDKSAFARGEARMQLDAMRAKQVLGDKLSESGTTPRALTSMLLLGGMGGLDPRLLATVPLGMAGSLRPVQKALLGGYEKQPMIADMLRGILQPASAGTVQQRN